MPIKIKSPKESVAVLNMNKATFHSYIFHLFFGAGQSCLLPFLSLYFRYLGLTASQVGIVFGAKAAVNMIWAPCWTRCSTKFRKKRFVMVFSMFILLGTYGLMIIIPPASQEISDLQFCPDEFRESENLSARLENLTETLTAELREELVNLSETSTVGFTEGGGEYRDIEGDLYNLDPEILKKNGIDSKTLKESDRAALAKIVEGMIKKIEKEKVKTRDKRDWHSGKSGQRSKNKLKPPLTEDEDSDSDEWNMDDEEYETTSKLTTSTTPVTTTTKVTTPTSTTTPSTTTTAPTTSTKAATTSTLTTTTRSAITSASSATTTASSATTTAVSASTSANPSDLITSTSLDLTTELLPNPSSTLSITVSVDINASTTPAPLSSTTPVSLLNYFSQDSVYNSFANIMNHIHELPKQINTVIYEKVFAAVMALIIVGEMFSAPAEKLADDTWFEFLDSSDLLEKYGTHKMWMALGCALLPPVLTTAIDRLPCLLAELGQYKIHRILLHFFAFYVLMGLAFVCSICFPIYSTKDGKKVLQRRGRFCRGLRMLFHDVQVSTFTISVLLMGFVQGATSTFLFWLIQDKTGAEQIMGLCLAAAFAGEFFMQGFGRWLVSKVGYAPCVVFGLLVLGGRFAFYSLIADPMYIIAGEGFHCLSVSLIWAAVRTYPDFRLNPLVMDRSANSVMNAFYHGIGLAPGCFTAGYIYDWVGLPILFQSCAVLCGVWAVIFAIVQCCSRKSPKVRYSKLMQDEEEALSDGSMEYDDDWLEVAMKHQK